VQGSAISAKRPTQQLSDTLALREGLPQAQLAVVPGTSHGLFAEKRETGTLQSARRRFPHRGPPRRRPMIARIRKGVVQVADTTSTPATPAKPASPRNRCRSWRQAGSSSAGDQFWSWSGSLLGGGSNASPPKCGIVEGTKPWLTMSRISDC
jgi:hypothetical protein